MQGRPAKGSRPKPPLSIPTRAEMRLLQILWDCKEATVDEVVNAHPAKERPNYKTTQTLLRIMEQKGFIGHESRGKVFVFSPLVSRKTVDSMSVQSLLSQNFGGSAAGLLMNLLETNAIKKKEIDEVEEYLREYRNRHDIRDQDRG
jgi:BlaI family penicillinase repressor